MRDCKLVAVDCGYYDQARFTNEFRALFVMPTAVPGGIALSGSRSQQPRRKHPRAAAIHTEALALAVVRMYIT